VNPTTEPETDEDEGEEPIAVLLPSGMRRRRIRAMFERQEYDSIANYPTMRLPAVCPSTAALLSQRDSRATAQTIESMIALCELYGDASGEIVFTERSFRLSVAAAPMLPQEITQHPRDVMRELAASKKQPGALAGVPHREPLSMEAHLERRQQQAALTDETPVTKPTKSSEELLEEAAMDRTEITPAFLDDFVEALQYAVENRSIAEAGYLVDGHRVITLDRKGIVNLWHPMIGEGAMQVAVRLRVDDPYRFIAKRHEVRAYLGLCKAVFAAKNITPIKAGEMYDWERKAQRGEKAA
jgi:hypothetical protein